MNGQMRTSKQNIIDDFLKRVDPYKKPLPISFDLRAYSKYVSENGLKADQITPEIMNRFIRA